MIEGRRSTGSASDHACCSEEHKGDELWPALPGFGGTALVYPFMLTEGPHKRGLSLERIVDLVATNPARAYGLDPPQGRHRGRRRRRPRDRGPGREHPVTTELLLSAQDHTPFEGMELTGWPVRTLLRGRTVFADGETVGEPAGAYLKRPLITEQPLTAP